MIDNFGYVAGGWRVERHPRFLADITGDGRADIVGFGDAGVYIALDNGDGSFGPRSSWSTNFGYVAGGWRVERHPRFLADVTATAAPTSSASATTASGSRSSNGDGSFAPPQLVVDELRLRTPAAGASSATRASSPTSTATAAPTSSASATPASASRSSNGDGTFQPPQLVVANFGYVAGGWRVERHPRFLADITGDGRADIVGFGDAGV